MTQALTTTIKGTSVPESLLLKTLIALPSSGFSKSDFAAALTQAGLPEARDGDLVRRLMQFLKRQGLLDYDDQNGCWSLTALGHMRVPHRTLPLQTVPAPVLPMLPARNPTWWDHLTGFFRVSLSHLACLGIIGALITLNASFAWELGGERRLFQVALVAALMSLDLMRPFLVATGLYLLSRGRWLLGSLGLSVALCLSPVSILSSTSILSASFLLGAEQNSDADIRSETRAALQAEHTRLLDRAAREEAAWQNECARGGCGPVADTLERQFETTVDEAKALLQRIVALSEAEQGTSPLLARLVTTFEGLGLFADDQQILLPLLLAISLELAALFGPALLLGRRQI